MGSTPTAHSLRTWFALDVEAQAAAREAVAYALMEAGALGTETTDAANGEVRITGYFAHTPQREQVRAELATALRIYDLPSSAVAELDLREVADEDWLGEWKKNWQPVVAGRRFVIAPPWAEVATSDRLVVRIEPGMAFGTGTHETTRLCLAAIEQYFSGGSFLDVGTGTGILAIAAAKLFPEARIEACDTDAAAVAIARENALLNDTTQIEFRVATIEATTASADFVCANLTADVIASLLPALVAVTCGRLVLSGILETQLAMVSAALSSAGAAGPIDIKQDGEWVAIIV
jgi:ribosomal protein L11 methyltransferase